MNFMGGKPNENASPFGQMNTNSSNIFGSTLGTGNTGGGTANTSMFGTGATFGLGNDPPKNSATKNTNPPQSSIFGSITTNTNVFGQSTTGNTGGNSLFNNGFQNPTQNNISTPAQNNPSQNPLNFNQNNTFNINPTQNTEKPSSSSIFTTNPPNEAKSLFSQNPTQPNNFTLNSQAFPKNDKPSLTSALFDTNNKMQAPMPPASILPEGGKLLSNPQAFAEKPKVEESKTLLNPSNAINKLTTPLIATAPSNISKPIGGLGSQQSEEKKPEELQSEMLSKKKVKSIIDGWKKNLKELVDGFGNISGKMLDYEKEIHETIDELIRHNAMINEMSDVVNKSKISLDSVIQSQNDIEMKVNSIFQILTSNISPNERSELLNEEKKFNPSYSTNQKLGVNKFTAVSEQLTEVEKKVDDIVGSLNSRTSECQNDINSNIENQLSSVFSLLETLGGKTIGQIDEINKIEQTVKNIKSSIY